MDLWLQTFAYLAIDKNWSVEVKLTFNADSFLNIDLSKLYFYGNEIRRNHRHLQIARENTFESYKIFTSEIDIKRNEQSPFSLYFKRYIACIGRRSSKISQQKDVIAPHPAQPMETLTYYNDIIYRNNSIY